MPVTNSQHVYSNSVYECFVDCLDSGVSHKDIRTPNSNNEAMVTPQREEWRKAEAMETESLLTNKVVKPALLPSERKAIRVR